MVKLIEGDGWVQVRQRGSHRAINMKKSLALLQLPIIGFRMKYPEEHLPAFSDNLG